MNALDRLADAAGIEPRYWDIQGRLHERSPDTARHLLSAMGIAARNDAEIAASLKARAEAPWRNVLPPVIVAQEEREIAVPIRMPVAARNMRWKIEYESGAQDIGECHWADLPIEDSAEIEGNMLALGRLLLPPAPAGYHRLHVNESSAPLIVAPPQCHLPPGGKRLWGVAAQLYALRSENNWGIGDFSDLRALMDWAAANGADAAGVNPLHALFLDAPEGASPYSPSSRMFLNPLYLDVTAIPDFAESAEARAMLESTAIADALNAARAAERVDYKNVAAIKLAILERLFLHFLHSNDVRAAAFRTFVRDAGADLQLFATFQMLSEHFGAHDWLRWGEVRDPASPETTRLANGNPSRIRFFQYLQWQCAEQLSAARAPSMSIGLYNDLAVSAEASSADHWAHQDLFMGSTRVGAPPDPFNETGQEWGVVPLDPHRLRETGYRHFIALLRANMRHAGALRIDHVMGLMRLFAIPQGGTPADGAYVRFPFDDLLAVAALESQRNKCVIIGEDLGTVPQGFREHMARAHALSYRVLYFEKEHGHFRRPADFPHLACVTVSTHDLATLRGFWTCEDIAAKARQHIFASIEEEEQARSERENDKRAILEALGAENLLPDGISPHEWMPELTNAIHVYLARSRGALFMAQLDDLANERLQANLPGAIGEYPNWQKRLARTLEDFATDTKLKDAMAGILRERASPE